MRCCPSQTASTASRSSCSGRCVRQALRLRACGRRAEAALALKIVAPGLKSRLHITLRAGDSVPAPHHTAAGVILTSAAPVPPVSQVVHERHAASLQGFPQGLGGLALEPGRPAVTKARNVDGLDEPAGPFFDCSAFIRRFRIVGDSTVRTNAIIVAGLSTSARWAISASDSDAKTSCSSRMSSEGTPKPSASPAWIAVSSSSVQANSSPVEMSTWSEPSAGAEEMRSSTWRRESGSQVAGRIRKLQYPSCRRWLARTRRRTTRGRFRRNGPMAIAPHQPKVRAAVRRARRSSARSHRSASTCLGSSGVTYARAARYRRQPPVVASPSTLRTQFSNGWRGQSMNADVKSRSESGADVS